MRHKRIAIAIALACQFGGVGVACASESIDYSYDVKGRLIHAVHSGAVNGGAMATYAFDATGNRVSVTVESMPSAGYLMIIPAIVKSHSNT